jgi:hypothetical protein
MAITDLVIPRRNNRALNFVPPLAPIPGTIGNGNPACLQYSTGGPYPPITSFGSLNDDVYACGYLNADGVLFGNYYPNPELVNEAAAPNGCPSTDLSEFVISGYDVYPNSSYLILAPDTAAYSLGPPKFPATGSINVSPTLGGIDLYCTCFFPVYSLGRGLLTRDATPDVFCIEINGAQHTAFQILPDFTHIASAKTSTDGVTNYSICDVTPLSGASADLGIMLSLWEPDGAFINHKIVLSDATDNAYWQNLARYDNGGVRHYIRNNNVNTWVVIDDPALLNFPVFLFANDYSWYDYILVDGVLDDAYPGVYWLDPNGYEYWVGVGAAGVINFQVSPPEPAPPSPIEPYGGGAATNPLRLSEIIKLPCFHPCVPHAKKGLKINV